MNHPSKSPHKPLFHIPNPHLYSLQLQSSYRSQNFKAFSFQNPIQVYIQCLPMIGGKKNELEYMVLQETKEKIVANLANFSYDPYNYTYLRQLNVVELFLDCITESNEKLVEFGVGGICNCCPDPANAAVITQCGGIPLVIQCLSSPVRNTVNYAIGSLYYLCNASNKEEIMKPEVVDVMKRYAAAEAASVSFSNLAKAFSDKYVSEHEL